MPGYAGIGPLSKGPMTGNGKGFCILKSNNEKPEKIEGYIGLQGQNYEKISDSDTDVLNLLKEGGEIMPLGDGTGPAGLGPMTGRAAGYCVGYPVPGYINPVLGRGFRGYGFFGRGRGFFGRGRGKGRGMGFRTMGNIPYSGYPYPVSGIALYAVTYFY